MLQHGAGERRVDLRKALELLHLPGLFRLFNKEQEACPPPSATSGKIPDGGGQRVEYRAPLWNAGSSPAAHDIHFPCPALVT
ncbi:hypothetical protein D3C76_1410800 [compost metagenome]